MLLRKPITKGCVPNSVLFGGSVSPPPPRYICPGPQPVLPHRWVDWRTIGPFQARHDEVDLLVRLAKPQRNSFEKDSHRVIALYQGEGVGCVRYVHIFGHARPRKRALPAPAY